MFADGIRAICNCECDNDDHVVELLRNKEQVQRR
jgi:hypothetical protein